MAVEANIIGYEFAGALAAYLADKPQAQCHSLAEVVASRRHHPQLTEVFTTRAQHPGVESEMYPQVQQRQHLLYQQLVTWFAEQQINVLAYPVVRHAPVRHGELQEGSNALISAVTGAPAISIPAGFDAEGLPIGVEILALRGREDLLLRVAEHIESSLSRQC